MVRKITETNERKQPVSISLTAVEIVMLNNLSKSMNMNRSRCLAGLIRDHSFKEMGLVALEVHAAPVQRWTHYRTGTDRPACNPKTFGKGRCTHPDCVKIYEEAGV